MVIINIKHSKTKPEVDVFLAGIIALGCNIGVSKMAQISSGINQNTMVNTVNWYFTLKALNAANQRVREFINRLALPNIFITDLAQRHGSSDGQKVNVAVESLLATYSFKYFGKDKGLSIYTFIDERQVLFHHNVMSSSEREAAYVIDGINNHDVAKIDIHSTDSHGYTELIFAATHFLEVTFAPRLKNIGKQKVYAFSPKRSYEALGYQGDEYIVLALNYCEGSGIDIYIQTEDHDEPAFISIDGFEFVNQNKPSSWVTVFSESHGRKVMTILPESWRYESFFEDMENQDPKAIELYNKEVEQIYREEGLL